MNGWLGVESPFGQMSFSQNLNFRDRLNLTWVSNSVVRIEIGSCSNDINSTFLNVTALIDVNIEAAGAGSKPNGLDADPATEAANTWYFVWLIYNPVINGYAGLLSTSMINPVMPEDPGTTTLYTIKRLLGAVRNNNSSNFYNFIMLGNGRDKTVIYRAVIDVNSNVVTPPAAANVGLTIFSWAGVGDIAFGAADSVIPCANLIPPFSRLALFSGYAKATYFNFSENIVNLKMVYIIAGAGYCPCNFELSTDTTQNISHARVATNAGTDMRLGVFGYRFAT